MASDGQHKPQPAPEVVYHYTSIDAMMKIAQAASIWATNISYLNDTSEGDHYLDLIRKRIPAYVSAHPTINPSIFARFLDDPRPNFLLSRPFVASFSALGDSLPQWRSYCPQGNGVAIGFKTDCLARSTLPTKQTKQDTADWFSSLLQPQVIFREIQYVDESKGTWLDDEIDAAILEAENRAAPAPEQDDDQSDVLGPPSTDPADYLRAILEGIAGFRKHPSFSNEREYRLLVENMGFNVARLEFRTTRSTLVPYVSVDVPRLHSLYAGKTEPSIWPLDGGRWQFVDHVILGPSPNKSLSLNAVSYFFTKFNLNVQVTASEIPYRDW